MNSPTCPSCDCVAGCQSRERLCPNLAEKADGTLICEGTKAVMKQALEFVEFCWRDVPMNDYAAEKRDAIEAALRAAIAQPAPACSDHPDAPHGFDRNSSHSADRYVCDCEGWQPNDNAPANIAYFEQAANKSYDLIDRFLRNNLDDEDYAEFSSALDSIYLRAAIAQPEQPSAQQPRTESEIVALAYTLSDSRYCSNRIGKVAFNYDQLQAFVTAIAQPEQSAPVRQPLCAMNEVTSNAHAVMYKKHLEARYVDGPEQIESVFYESMEPVRQPLTHTEIVKIYDESMSEWVFERDNPYVKFARAIEVAHGIAQPKDKS